MIYLTLAQIRARVRRELDLIDEPQVDDTEITDIINDAIDIAEANIMTLHQDYFLTSAFLSLVTSTALYALPADIYSTKIRGLVYADGVKIYPVKKLKGPNLFEKMAEIDQYGSTEDYRYVPINASAAAGMKLQLFPTSRETSSTVLKIWYIRNAARLSADADVCDIPEFSPFLIAYTKWKVALREPLPMAQSLGEEAEMQRQLMVDTLTEMVPDEDDEIPADLTHYIDHN